MYVTLAVRGMGPCNVHLLAVPVLCSFRYNIQFAKVQPDLSMCERHLPANYIGLSVYEWPETAPAVWPIHDASRDSTCPVDEQGRPQYYVDYAGSMRPPETNDTHHAQCIRPCVNVLTVESCK